MDFDYSSAELIGLWLAILLVIILAMAFYVMRKKALSLLFHSDQLAERVRLIEDELENERQQKNQSDKEVLSLKSALMDTRAERDDFIDLLNAAPIAVWRRDQQSRIVWHNKKYEDIVGGPNKMGEIEELVSSREPDRARKLAAKARVAMTPQTELRRYVVEGDLHSFRIHEVPLEFENELAGFAEDVSREEAMAQEMQTHLRGQENVLENIPTAVAIYGSDQRLNFYNQAYAKLWKLSDSFLEDGPTIIEVLDKQRELRRLPEQADFSAYRAKRRALFTNLIETKEELVQLPDETVLRTLISPHSSGGLFFMFEDITDKMALERAHNTQTAVQRATLDNLYEGVAVFGADARLKLYNSGFTEIWGATPEMIEENLHIRELMSRIFGVWKRDTDEDEMERYVANVTRRDPYTGQMTMPNDRIINYNRVPLPDGNVLFTYIDVTDQLNVQRALTERNDALEAADKMKTEFVASVSHELRTPLNTIIGFAEILVKQFFGELNEKQSEYGRGILESSNHLLHLINDILDMANIQAGKIELELEPVEVHALLANVVTMVHDRARKRRVQIDFEMINDLGWANLDERRMKQVIFNLFSNSIKFTEAGGSISLEAERQKDEMIIRVIDTGIGIPKETQDHIFERFAKGDTTSQNAGAGLGLSLVKSFVEMHGGHVELQSEEGKGTTIACHLPSSLYIDNKPS
ncbi:PAS domain-containing protein [Sneathiella sp. P13V-1]|uniref:sensor histidine kinase n=1 Tax=Sneathiella sp. P13V-1 TaxID=2697366 RepID=UPI00187B2BED|nr:PAS domain-containing sensor histidine kinase [Sneathiella sp. P13V-1]MBE7636013.1 PAS domain-containing protein [Sneathiella sp. P13V-1]